MFAWDWGGRGTIKLAMPKHYVYAHELAARWWTLKGERYETECSPPVEGRFMVETMAALHPQHREEWRNVYVMLQQFSGIVVEKEGRNTYVKTPYDPYYVDMLRNLGGKWDRERKMWRFYNCSSSVRLALSVMGGSSRSRLYVDDSSFPHDLLPHQIDGAAFFVARWNAGYRGSLLAHDQGTGKTRASLAFCRTVLEQEQAKNILFVSTASHQRSICGEWVAVGGSPDEFAVLSSLKDLSELEQYTLWVTTPEYLFHSNNKALFERVIASMPSTILVIDEAGRFTNMRNASYRHMLCLSLPAVFVCALSGTPLINSILDMEGLIQLIDPSVFPWRDFYAEHVVEKPMKIFSRPRYNKLLEQGAPREVAQAKSVITIPKIETINHEAFAERVSGFFHRVTKDDVKELNIHITPFVVPIELTADTLEHRLLVKLEDFMRICRMKMNAALLEEKLSSDGQITIPKRELDVLIRQQQIFDDPYLLWLFADIDAAKKADDSKKQDVNKKKQDIPDLLSFLLAGESRPSEMYWGVKMNALAQVLREHSGEKVVIFTQFSTMAHLLTERLKKSFGEQSALCVTGATPSAPREKILAKFKENEEAKFLVGTDAISHAVNLQFVDCLIHYDLPWTSHMLNQRTDRICRLNAKNSQKHIYVLYCETPFTSVNVERLKCSYIVKKAEIARKILGDSACSTVVEEIYFHV
ncbi:DEAD/DEAH box helicase [Thermovirga lienii]|uniref:DEAD/DEAH box helicase n=1 Tax=Thermovirga lienii TaxID=336261 RepID=UPI002FE1E233